MVTQVGGQDKNTGTSLDALKPVTTTTVSTKTSLDVNVTNGITVATGDIEIGAVELKNYNTDDRLQISTAHAALVDINNASIEQATAATHTDLSIAIAGKSGTSKVRPILTDETGATVVTAGTNLNTSLLALEAGGNLAASATSLGLLDNSVDGNYLNINNNIAGTDVAAGSGTVNAQTQRVVLATDVALPTGTNSIGATTTNAPIGSGVDSSITLTSATTAYSFPSSIPSVKYLLIVYNGSDTDMRLRFTTGTTLGWLLPAGGEQTFDMGASQVLYAWCASAGKILTYSTKAWS